MTTYQVVIEETISSTFEVQAGSGEEALEIARANYKSGKFIVDSECPTSKQMAVTGPDGEQTEWEVF